MDRVKALSRFGNTGFLPLFMTQRTEEFFLIAPGCVGLLLSSTDVVAVEIPGLVSCDATASRPTGQTCWTGFAGD